MTTTYSYRKRPTVLSGLRPLFKPWGLWRTWRRAFGHAAGGGRAGLLVAGLLLLLLDTARYLLAALLLAVSLVLSLLAGAVLLVGLVVATLFGAGVGVAYAERGNCAGTSELWR